MIHRREGDVTAIRDLFVEHPASARYNRDWARSRRKGGSLGPNKMNRTWSVESTFSNTGERFQSELALLRLASQVEVTLSRMVSRRTVEVDERDQWYPPQLLLADALDIFLAGLARVFAVTSPRLGGEVGSHRQMRSG